MLTSPSTCIALQKQSPLNDASYITCITVSIVIITLSLCELACEATTVRQAFNSKTPVNKEEIGCQTKS